MLSLFINNLTYSIIDNIVVLSILWLLYAAFKSIFKLTPGEKHKLAFTFLVFSTLYFCIEIFYYEDFHLLQNLQLTNIYKEINVKLIGFSNLYYRKNIFSFITFIYLITFVALIVRLAIQYNGLRVLKNSSEFQIDNYFELVLSEMNKVSNFNIKIGFNNGTTTPIVFGILEHIVLLPVALCNHISQEELKMLLMHEYAHILRKDFFINLVIELSSVVLWFNPLMYIFKNEINLQREIACDEYVVTNSNNPIGYSKALVVIAENSIGAKQNLSLAAHSNESDLKTRIEFINGINSKSKQKTGQKKIRMACLFIVSSIYLINTFNEEIPNQTKYAELHFTSVNSKYSEKLKSQIAVSFHSKKSHKRTSKNARTFVVENQHDKTIQSTNEKELAYSDLVNQTKNWIKAHEDPILFTGYNENNTFNAKDSTEESLANKLLILSIVKNYQLKKAIFDEKIKNIANQASNKNEAMDYLLNSKEWNEMVQYEKWVHEFLQRQ